MWNSLAGFHSMTHAISPAGHDLDITSPRECAEESSETQSLHARVCASLCELVLACTEEVTISIHTPRNSRNGVTGKVGSLSQKFLLVQRVGGCCLLPSPVLLLLRAPPQLLAQCMQPVKEAYPGVPIGVNVWRKEAVSMLALVREVRVAHRKKVV